MKILKQKFLTLTLFLISGIATFIWTFWRFKFGSNAFWDFRVYTRAVADSQLGLNPYQSRTELPFMYHPYILELLVKIDNFVPISIFLSSLYILCSVFFFLSLIQFLKLDNLNNIDTFRKLSLIIVLSLGLGGSSLVAFVSGNVSTFLHLLIAGIFFQIQQKYSRKKVGAFLVSIAFATLIKPYFALYLFLLPIFFGISTSLFLSGTSILGVILLWMSGKMLYPLLYSDFIEKVRFVTIERGDLGFSAFSILKRRLGEPLALTLHLSLVALLLFLVFFISQKYLLTIRETLLWYFPLPFAIITFTNPRLKEYDLVISVLLMVAWLIFRGGKSGEIALLTSFVLFLSRTILFLLQNPLNIKIHDSLIYLKYWEFLTLLMLIVWMLYIPPKQLFAKKHF